MPVRCEPRSIGQQDRTAMQSASDLMRRRSAIVEGTRQSDAPYLRNCCA